MKEFGILMIIFGFMIILAGLYLIYHSKGDFTKVLLWKSNVNKMTKEDIKYAGKVTLFVSLSPIITGIISLFINESILPILILIISFIFFLILALKIFKK